MKSFLVDFSNSNIEFNSYQFFIDGLLDISLAIEQIKSLSTFHSSMDGNINFPSSSEGAPEGLSNSGQPEGSDNPNGNANAGSGNSSGISDAVYNEQRRGVGSKLRDLFINKPPFTRIRMTDPIYSDKISIWDHNIVCRSIIDVNDRFLLKSLQVDENGHIRFKGVISIRLLDILEK